MHAQAPTPPGTRPPVSPHTPPTVRRVAPSESLPLSPTPVPQPAALPPPTAPDPTALKWDEETKDFTAKPGDVSAAYNFVVTNGSDHEIMLNRLRTSCGCTVAQLPTTPYKLAPGANVSIAVTMDLRGKSGTLTKTITVESSAGVKSLIVRATIPPLETVAPPGGSVVPSAATSSPLVSNVITVGGGPASGGPTASPPAPVATAGVPVALPASNGMRDRAMNIQNALADRQAVFRGECAKCHVDPGVGKLGADLYMASCGICHEAEHRATMVPDLKVPRGPRDLAFWQKWIAEGKPGTLMPAFAAVHGGPLNQDQADSLAVYLYQYLPRNLPIAAILPPPLPSAESPPAPPPGDQTQSNSTSFKKTQ